MIHAAGVALLTALLACSAGAAGEPTPTETPTPETTEEAAATETATATATEEVQEDPTVSTTEELNVRAGPDENCAILGTYAANTEVKVLAKDPSGQWWQVPYNDEIGWMSAAYTTPVTDLSSVQEIPGPACQPPANTSTPTGTATSTSSPPTATATATSTTAPYCGDGALNGNEQCDGQAGSCGIGQFCNDSCQCEGFQIQPAVCGNDVKETGEQCDGSNAGCGIGQFCNDSCQCELFQIQFSVCGNNIKESGEQCDGSNAGCGIGQYCSDSCTCESLQISP